MACGRAFRLAALLHAVGSGVAHAGGWAHPRLGVTVLVAMAAWSLVTIGLYAGPDRRSWPVLTVDLALTVAALLASVAVLSPAAVAAGDPTLTVSWAAAPVPAWAVRGAWHGGAFAGVASGVADVVERAAPRRPPSTASCCCCSPGWPWATS